MVPESVPAPGPGGRISAAASWPAPTKIAMVCAASIAEVGIEMPTWPESIQVPAAGVALAIENQVPAVGDPAPPVTVQADPPLPPPGPVGPVGPVAPPPPAVGPVGPAGPGGPVLPAPVGPVGPPLGQIGR